MKENRKFFDNNRLNKGYGKVMNFNQSDSSLISKKYRHVLPPIEMIEEYEEIYPGTVQKLFDMTEREQSHRHAMDLREIEKHAQTMKLGRTFALSFVAIVALGSFALVAVGNLLIAGVFAALGFACIAVICSCGSKKCTPKEPNKTKYHGSHYAKSNNNRYRPRHANHYSKLT